MLNEYQLPEQLAMDRKPKLNYYIRLESESSLASEEDTESVNSLQDRETEFVQDTEDTDTDSYIEYEVASLSDPDEPASSNISSGADDIYVTEEVIAAVLGDTSTEASAADGREDSYSSASDSEDFGKTDFWTCVQCQSKNNDPRYRLCEKCFQVRKNFYPPRPKRNKKRKNQSKQEAVNVDNLKNCLSGLSQDSGVGSSQEFPGLNFTEIKVPEQHLNNYVTSSGSEISTASSSGLSSISLKSADSGYGETTTKKRKYSGNFSDDEVRPKKIIIEGSLNSKSESTAKSLSECTEDKAELKEMCIICTLKKKDGIFLHGNSAHSCCCYKCAIKTWKSTKRCPVCNRRVSNVVKLFTI